MEDAWLTCLSCSSGNSMEKLDEQMQEVLSALVNENDVQVAAEKLSDAWDQGHANVLEAQQNPSFCIRNS